MENAYLVHHGIKGMKWGVRRSPEQLGHRISARREEKKQRKAVAAFEGNYKRNWYKAHNDAADAHEVDLARINKKYGKYNFSKVHNGTADRDTKIAWNNYCTELGASWTKRYNDALLKNFGEHPTLGKNWVDQAVKTSDYEAFKVEID